MLNVREPECAAPCMRAPGLAHSRFSLTGTLRDSLLSACADRYCLDARCGLALRVSRSGGLEQYLYSFQCHSSGRRAPAGLWPGAAAHARLCPDSECPSLCVASLLRCYSHKQHQWVPRRGGFNAPGLAPACHTLSRWSAHSIAARGLYRAGAPPAGDSGPHPPPSLTGPRAGPPAVSVLPTASRSLSYNTRTAAGLAGSRRPGSQRHHSRGRRREWGPAGTGVTVTSARIRTS